MQRPLVWDYAEQGRGHNLLSDFPAALVHWSSFATAANQDSQWSSYVSFTRGWSFIRLIGIQ